MKLGTVELAGGARPVAYLDEDRYLDLRWAFGSGRLAGSSSESVPDAHTLTLVGVIEAGRGVLGGLKALLSSSLPDGAIIVASEARLLAPIPLPRKNIFCVGRNYAGHIAEDNVSREKSTEIPKYPQFFTKPPTAVIGPGEDVLLHTGVTRRLDYEVELAVVIGRRGKNISVADAKDYVYGYTILNDVTARDLQARHDQWFKGKGLDGSAPMGPWIVTGDDIPDPQALQLFLSVNNQVRQDASTSTMIFQISEIISSLSQGLTLEPGDIIATGTPSGVGYAMNPRQWLNDGDEIVCRIEPIGTLANRVRAI